MATKRQKRRRRRRNLILAGLGTTAVAGGIGAVALSRKKATAATQNLRSKINDIDRELGARANQRKAAREERARTQPQREAQRQQAGDRFSDALETTRRKLVKKRGTKMRLDEIAKGGKYALPLKPGVKSVYGSREGVDLANLKNLDRSTRSKIAQQIAQNRGGKKSTRTNYVNRRKLDRSTKLQKRKDNAFGRLTSKQKSRLSNRLGYSVERQRFRRKTSKSSRKKAIAMLKSLGRFQHRFAGGYVNFH